MDSSDVVHTQPIPTGEEVSGTEREIFAMENGRPAGEAERCTDEAEEKTRRSEFIPEAGNGSTEPGVDTAKQNMTQDTAVQEQ
ncbi:hypothetical protein DPMN_070868 [Dreissena polymorpha]|uniref:Uncharacterized protein n=1 Tax=Dreissena polymorpha TaxID=45954 RepID=A0A9D4BXA0_DREPO|nr:hypothetical protein DPMN_070868 [Dreissena polymorpha]